MLKRDKTETENFYRGLLAEQKRSGMSLRAFAASRGIPSGTLSSWRHHLKRRDADRASKNRSTASFVAVNVVESAPQPTPVQSAAIYEVVLGRDRVLRLPADFNEARVAALVKAVTSC